MTLNYKHVMIMILYAILQMAPNPIPVPSPATVFNPVSLSVSVLLRSKGPASMQKLRACCEGF